jgi:hypothetical protein
MRKVALGVALFLAAGIPAVFQAQTDPATAPGASAAPAVYRISFERREVVPGVNATPVIQLPRECTSDGTIFISFVSTVRADSGMPPAPPVHPPMLLTSVSPSGRGQTFPLDRVPQLFISREVDHYASDSGVFFLVEAAKENKPIKQAYSVGDYHGEFTRNAAEQHRYVVEFSRNGEYRRTVAIDDLFQTRNLGVFSSGKFLVFGYEKSDHSPRLAILNEDGALIKFLEIPKGYAPEFMTGGRDSQHPLSIAMSELVPYGRSILAVQNELDSPILEVSEDSAIREIHPRLPDGQQIHYIVAADRGLYIIAGPPSMPKGDADTIYEVNPDDGTLLRQFELNDSHRPLSELACVHDGKFLSLDYRDGDIVPLIGSPEPEPNSVQPPQGKQ